MNYLKTLALAGVAALGIAGAPAQAQDDEGTGTIYALVHCVVSAEIPDGESCRIVGRLFRSKADCETVLAKAAPAFMRAEPADKHYTIRVACMHKQVPVWTEDGGD